MGKTVLIPRGLVKVGAQKQGVRCRGLIEGSFIIFDCQDCPSAERAPAKDCVDGIRKALDEHPMVEGMQFRGDEDVWIREKGIESLRVILDAENAWDDLRRTIISLPCTKQISLQRTNGYIESIVAGSSDPFCRGDAAHCAECMRIQFLALDRLNLHRRKARRTLATDRFKIIDVPEGPAR